MEHTKKLMVVPWNTQQPEPVHETSEIKPSADTHVNSIRPPKKNVIKERAALKMEKILKLVLSLARINGYDAYGRIRSGNGFMENTDIVSLINNVLTPKKYLVGENEFITLLIEADIDPSLIVNENIRTKIEQKWSVTKEPKIIVNETKDVPAIAYKRPIEESDEDEEPLRKKKLSNWTIPQDSDDDF